jgi:hypothetical protein
MHANVSQRKPVTDRRMHANVSRRKPVTDRRMHANVSQRKPVTVDACNHLCIRVLRVGLAAKVDAYVYSVNTQVSKHVDRRLRVAIEVSVRVDDTRPWHVFRHLSLQWGCASAHWSANVDVVQGVQGAAAGSVALASCVWQSLALVLLATLVL